MLVRHLGFAGGGFVVDDVDGLGAHEEGVVCRAAHVGQQAEGGGANGLGANLNVQDFVEVRRCSPLQALPAASQCHRLVGRPSRRCTVSAPG